MPFQRRGIALTLWQAALAACIETAQLHRLTVNASAVAVPVYLRLGFAALGPEDVRKGVKLTPMAFAIENPDSPSN